MNTQFWTSHLDTATIGAALLLANLHLLGFGLPPTTLALQPAQFPHAWWGVVTHPFVHVSAYHLLLDALAFFALYPACAPDGRGRVRLLVACAICSLAGALGDPAVAANGFCGLSGIDHGLMAATTIAMCRRARFRADAAIGATLLAVVGLKCAIELAHGVPAFASFHLGDIGQPVVASHAGGVIGALALMLLQRKPPRPAHAGRGPG
jgi:membrane associated rhomboid family serine protease